MGRVAHFSPFAKGGPLSFPQISTILSNPTPPANPFPPPTCTPLCQPWLVGHAKSSRKASLISVTLQATLNHVRIRNFAHKGLRTLYSDNSAKGVPPDSADKLRKMLAFLDAMQDPEELRALPSWKPHTLTGDRKGTWSLTVTRNRRLTFRIHAADLEICDLNLEDYH